MAIEAFGYEGKRALVIGGASGMGAATAKLVGELGADVVVADYVSVSIPVSKAITVDLRDQASIDHAIGQLTAPIHAVFSCAGIAGSGSDVIRVNFLGQRYLIEQLLAEDLVPAESAVAMISSTAGLGWERDLPVLDDLLDTSSFEEGLDWLKAHPEQMTYAFSKKAVCAYVVRQGLPFLQRGIRINAIQPGPTDTPLARANAETWLIPSTGYREAAGIHLPRPDEQAYVLAFLCSAAARYVKATNIITDGGRTSSRMMHGFPPPYVW
jgi:NAD(P)-dependent dehydrogenase (short-subunit alcohol dehydrogenase family)